MSVNFGSRDFLGFRFLPPFDDVVVNFLFQVTFPFSFVFRYGSVC